jgi:hypothetical protein
MVKLEDGKELVIDTNTLVQNANERAQDSYDYETGRRSAVDRKLITMEELSIYYFVNDFVLSNSKHIDLFEDKNAVKIIEQKAFLMAAQAYKTSEQKAEEIFTKVGKIPKVFEG